MNVAGCRQVLGAVSRCGAATSVCVDRAAGAALVHFEQAAAAGAAVRELRRVAAQASAAEPDHPRLCVDYASRECQVPWPPTRILTRLFGSHHQISASAEA